MTHALPAALVVWAIVLYRRPLFSGAMLGPGVWHDLLSDVPAAAVDQLLLAARAGSISARILRHGWRYWWSRWRLRPATWRCSWLGCSRCSAFNSRWASSLRGAWQFWNEVYRYPILAAFIGLCISFVLWPAQKNLATLMSCSAAIMLGTQFWHAHGGGLALAWYLPLLLLTVFRPNLEDRVATTS